MSAVAILVGNSTYVNLQKLNCCRNDVLAIKDLLEATEKYSEIYLIEDAGADDLKVRIRAAVSGRSSLSEIFFYFSGHGVQSESDFFFCASNFEARRPNETGLSTSELHTLLRMGEADLVVKVVDACNSGTLLVKDGGGFFLQEKHGFKNIVQIASCLDSQNSLAGDPLSEFTDKFIKASLRKEEGEVYYIDIVGALRDAYIENSSQTPHFVFQVTGREQFVDDAKRLLSVRKSFLSEVHSDGDAAETSGEVVCGHNKLLQILENAEGRIVSQSGLRDFVDKLFDGIGATLSCGEFADFFDFSLVEHADFVEPTARGFMIRVLSNESRPDNFVTASITREAKRRDPFRVGFAWEVSSWLGGDNDIFESYNLKLNCAMNRAQIKITLTPKYSSLQQIVLVISCAPSLENCYVFEVATQHSLRDFGVYSDSGSDLVRRWYKMLWTDSAAGLVEKITGKLIENVREHLEAVERRLSKD